MYIYGCNAILAMVIINRSDKDMIRDFSEYTIDLKIEGINPGFHFIYNKATTALKMGMTTMDINYQLVPLINHRAHNGERAIQTFKNNFIVGQCTIYKDLYFQLWDRLLQQETISLNLLSKSRIRPRLSAYTHIFGEFYYNRTTLCPPETRLVIHNRQKYITLWAPHIEHVWYIGPDMGRFQTFKNNFIVVQCTI